MILYPADPPPPPPPPPPLSFTHIFVSHTIFHTHLCQPPSVTHTFLSTTIFRVAGVALGDIYLGFARQAWNFVTSTFVSHGTCCTYGTGLALVPGLVAGDAAALCVAGVALGDIYLGFTWQAWHLMTSAFVLRGRRVTYGTGLALVSHAIFVTHHLSHTHLSHTIFHTHPLSQPTLSHTIFDTPSFTHNFVSHHLSPHHLSHTAFTHTIFHTQLCHTPLCFTSRSSTTSLVFPSFPVPATIFGAHYWKRLPCGVFRSFGLTCHGLHSGTAEALAPALPELPAEVRIDERRLGTELASGIS